MNATERRQYWHIYKTKKKQISLTLSWQEYRYWQQIAEDRGETVGQQIKAEATAYQRRERVPNLSLERKLARHTHVLRGIANNLNQIARHSNTFRKFLHSRQTFALLRQLEQAADRFIRQG